MRWGFNGRSGGRENGTNSTFATGSDDIRQEVPTFYDFVQYLLSVDVRSMDEHWRYVGLTNSVTLSWLFLGLGVHKDYFLNPLSTSI